MLASSLARFVQVIGITLWLIAGVIIGQIIAGLLVFNSSLVANAAVQAAVAAGLGYTMAILLIIGTPLLTRRKKLDYKLLGVDRLPSWSDIGLGTLSVLPYFLLATVVVWLGTDILRFIDPTVGQQVSFTDLYLRIEYIVAFITLVVVAPLAEELLFRGYFQGKAVNKIGKVLGVIFVAIIFGLMHLIGFTDQGVVLQWGAAADTFSLGIIVGVLRLITGSIWAGVILHALKNGIAYYFLFIAVAS
jgi:membrane protease YdiL (CAAX protease family)